MASCVDGGGVGVHSGSVRASQSGSNSGSTGASDAGFVQTSGSGSTGASEAGFAVASASVSTGASDAGFAVTSASELTGASGVAGWPASVGVVASAASAALGAGPPTILASRSWTLSWSGAGVASFDCSARQDGRRIWAHPIARRLRPFFRACRVGHAAVTGLSRELYD